MSDHAVSLIRTYVPLWVGIALTRLAELTGPIDIDGEGLITAVTGIVVAVYYAVARAIEAKYPAAGILLGKRAAPSYEA